MCDPVPYQAYRSKRHSHNLSSSYLVPNVSAPLVSQPPNIARSPSSIDGQNNSTAISEPSSMHCVTVASDSSASESSAGPSSPQIEQHKPIVKKPSTYRRIAPRNARPSLPSSPLASHSHNLSVSSTNTLSHHDIMSDTEQRGLTDTQNLLASSILRDTQLHFTPPPDPPNPVTNGSHRPATASVELVPSTIVHAPPLVSSSSNVSRASSASHTPQRSTSTPPSSKSLQRTQVPYHPGFQPKGFYRPLTDEFIALRRVKRDGEEKSEKVFSMKRVERTKLTRRLEKLIDIHFPIPNTQIRSELIQNAKRNSRAHAVSMNNHNRRSSSIFDFDIRNMSISDAGEIFRGIIGGDEVRDIRAAEQRITPWQDDADATKCPLCGTSFHPITNRKHHCRLCGQIICSLPIKRPQRPVTCSLLFVVDQKTRRIEEAGESVDYGVRRRAESVNSYNVEHADEEKLSTGVRICRACRPVLLRQQYEQEITHVPTFAKLYEVLLDLEHKIETLLPRFQELVLNLSNNDQPTKEASAMRKHLLESFAQYDSLAKRIRKLPCPNGPGSSQDRIQLAIMTRASLFLQKNMFPLQSLPTPQRAATKLPTQLTLADDSNHPIDADSKIAHMLQPLLEQEALLESFVEEAKARRKFEDVKTLKVNLVEIREEIKKIVNNVESGMQGVES